MNDGLLRLGNYPAERYLTLDQLIVLVNLEPKSNVSLGTDMHWPLVVFGHDWTLDLVLTKDLQGALCIIELPEGHDKILTLSFTIAWLFLVLMLTRELFVFGGPVTVTDTMKGPIGVLDVFL